MEADTPHIFMQFADQGNIMEIDEYRQALYQVDGLKISFDLSSFLTMEKNLTVEGFKEFLPDINKAAEALLPYAKFEGMFNAEKTELTIEKFPGMLAKGGAPGEVKLQLRKK